MRDRKDSDQKMSPDEKREYFVEELTKGLTNTFYANSRRYPDFFSSLTGKKYSIKQPELTEEVIEATSKYNLPQHQITISQWIKNTKDVNAVDENGNTLLHHAAITGKANLIEWFINKNLSIDAINGKSQSPLIAAIERAIEIKTDNPQLRQKLFATIEKLLSLGAKNVPSCDDESKFMKLSAMRTAVRGNDLELVKILVTHGVECREDDHHMSFLWQTGALTNNELADFLSQHDRTTFRNVG